MFFFDLIPNLIAAAISILLPTFLSYKALQTNDPAILTPWLIYWTVFSLLTLFESYLVSPFLGWFPFYATVRLFVLCFLALPQTQGATTIYFSYVEPFLREHENKIETFIADAHQNIQRLGWDFIKRAVEWVRVNGMGLPPARDRQREVEEEERRRRGQQQQGGSWGWAASAAEGLLAQQGNARGGAQPNAGALYAQSLLTRFMLPNTSSSTATHPPTSAPIGSGADFYSLLNIAVNQLSSASSRNAPPHQSSSRDMQSSDTFAPPGSFADSSLFPPSIRDSNDSAAKLSFVSSQRDKLRYLLSALDTEARVLETENRGRGGGGGGQGLTKSKSEAEFETVDREDYHNGGSGSRESDRRESGGGGGGMAAWMPSFGGWGRNGQSDSRGRTSGVDLGDGGRN
ncbi:hypothetical protein MMC25_000260 [Agyrium rufum]|nr:hypothetical protein [Agyrium rufum]